MWLDIAPKSEFEGSKDAPLMDVQQLQGKKIWDFDPPSVSTKASERRLAGKRESN